MYYEIFLNHINALLFFSIFIFFRPQSEVIIKIELRIIHKK